MLVDDGQVVGNDCGCDFGSQSCQSSNAAAFLVRRPHAQRRPGPFASALAPAIAGCTSVSRHHPFVVWSKLNNKTTDLKYIFWNSYFIICL